MPQGHLPAFWLIVSQSHLGPQAQANLATVLEDLALVQPSAFSSGPFRASFPEFEGSIGEESRWRVKLSRPFGVIVDRDILDNILILNRLQLTIAIENAKSFMFDI